MRQALICTSEFADSETFSSALLEREKLCKKKYIVYCLSLFLSFYTPPRMYKKKKYCGANKLFLDTYFIHADFSLYDTIRTVLL